MTRIRLLLVVTALTAGAAPAYAYRGPELPQAVPDHVREARYAEVKSPYAMSYSDEAAQKLGLKDGQWEAFKSDTPGMPSFNAGVGDGGPMLRLQWR
jgi:hypothetical protein